MCIYLESGTIIDIGTILQFIDKDLNIVGWYQVNKLINKLFVELNCINDCGYDIVENLSISEIQEMYDKNLIRIYNK